LRTRVSLTLTSSCDLFHLLPLPLCLCLHSRRSIRSNLRTHHAVREQPQQAPDQHTERRILLDAGERPHPTPRQRHEVRHEAQLPSALGLEILHDLGQPRQEEYGMLASVQRFEDLRIQLPSQQSRGQSAVERGLHPDGRTPRGRVVVNQGQAGDALGQDEDEFAIGGEGELLEEAVGQGDCETGDFEFEGGDAQAFDALVFHDDVDLGELEEHGGGDDGVAEEGGEEGEETVLGWEVVGL